MVLNEAFVICQIGDEGTVVRKRADELYNYIIQPVLKEFELEGRRSDKVATPGQVTSQIVKALISARVVIADLTGRNPNVYYELAVAHAFAQRVIILVDNPGSLSFDTQNERVIAIGDEGQIGVTQAEEAKKRLRDTLKVVLAEGYKPSSLVTEVAGSQSLANLAPDDPEAAGLSAIKERVDQVFFEVQRLGRRGKGETDALREDRIALIRFVERLTTARRLTVEELGELITPSTSDGFDHWVERLATQVEEAPQAAADAWGPPAQAAQGGSGDEGSWGPPSPSSTDWGWSSPESRSGDEGGF